MGRDHAEVARVVCRGGRDRHDNARQARLRQGAVPAPTENSARRSRAARSGGDGSGTGQGRAWQRVRGPLRDLGNGKAARGPKGKSAGLPPSPSRGLQNIPASPPSERQGIYEHALVLRLLYTTRFKTGGLPLISQPAP